MAISKINPIAMGVTLGVLSAVVIFSLAMLVHTFLAGIPISVAVGTLYITYNTSVLSSLTLALVGSLASGAGGYIFSRVYNLLVDVV